MLRYSFINAVLTLASRFSAAIGVVILTNCLVYSQFFMEMQVKERATHIMLVLHLEKSSLLYIKGLRHHI